MTCKYLKTQDNNQKYNLDELQLTLWFTIIIICINF